MRVCGDGRNEFIYNHIDRTKDLRGRVKVFDENSLSRSKMKIMLFQNPVSAGKSFVKGRTIYFSSTVHNPIQQIKLFRSPKSFQVNKPVQSK